MQSYQTEFSGVMYNAAEQAFEAKVTVHGDNGSTTYACSIDAPITCSFEDAAAGLAKQALRKHGAPRGLRSWLAEKALPRTSEHRKSRLRRGLPLGQYGFFRGRAA